MAWTEHHDVVGTYSARPFKLTLVCVERESQWGCDEFYMIVVAKDGAIWETEIVRGSEAAARERYEAWKPIIAVEVAKRALRIS